MGSGDKVTVAGQTLTERVWALLADAYAAAGIDASRLAVSQGSWHHGPQSGSTHNGGGAFDLRIGRLQTAQLEPLVVELRQRNVCAWHRDQTHGGFDPHIHGIVRDEDDLSHGARWQVQEYDAGRDGLTRAHPDYHPRPEQRPFRWPVTDDPTWTRDLRFHATGDDVEHLLAAIHPEGTRQLTAARRRHLAPTLDSATWARIKDTQSHHPEMADELERGVVGPVTWQAITGHP